MSSCKFTKIFFPKLLEYYNCNTNISACVLGGTVAARAHPTAQPWSSIFGSTDSPQDVALYQTLLNTDVTII